MGEKLVVGPMAKGLKQNPLGFYIDNDSFPVLQNAFAWRGRVKRKRGTSQLGRLNRKITSTNSNPVLTLSGGIGSGNLITTFSLQANSAIVQGSLNLTDGTNTYTDSMGIITGSPGGSGTINYATGDIAITGGSGNSPITGTFSYYPCLPVMGLEDLNLNASQFAGTLAFDTVYSYNVNTNSPYNIYDVSFYKNPATSTYTNYVKKTTQTPLTWNGQPYQQFWSVNYQGAFWATNGINVPFNISNIGMQYKPIVSVTNINTGPPYTAELNIIGHGLVVGDFLFINEVQTTTGINFQTGYVTTVVDANNVIVTFPSAVIATDGSGGIAQYLTNRSDPTKDCLRWYDGDPTQNNGINGWVNFMPPLFSELPNFGIDDAPPAQYYLIGARLIWNFKDRLIFFGPVVQTSAAGSQIYLQDTIIFSENGTPYYTASFQGTTTKPTSIQPILVPPSQTALPSAWFEDIKGFGGYLSAGYAQPILSVAPNEDVLIVGFSNRQTRLVYTGNDLLPFAFYVVNSELGTGSTFSTITLDRGVLSLGDHGIIITRQYESQRIDIDIPDKIFEIMLTNQGAQRVCAQRNFVTEWIYFTYPSDMDNYNFPTESLLYNYRENTWAIMYETYTTYGQFRQSTGNTWATIGSIFPMWSVWNEPWNAGVSNALQPVIIAGNAQGFVIRRDVGTGEANSLYIQSFSGQQITSPNHCLNAGDYIVINGCLGTIGSGINGQIFQVSTTPSPTANTFSVEQAIPAGTYLGGGMIQRMYIPLIQSKQFNPAWGMARKTRLGPQQYLLTSTDNGQVTLNIYLSQNQTNYFNAGPIVPTPNTINNSLIYSTVLYTCPESTNLGLTPANTNLQMNTFPELGVSLQSQIWHRMNTSLIGDTVQVGITLNNLQMTDPEFNNQFEEIELHGFCIDISQSSLLA